VVTVILSQRGLQNREVLLAGVPRVGETIQLVNGRATTRLSVEHVLWQEGSPSEPTPSVVVVVRPRSDGPED
jgi:hypothetical protein